MFKVCINKRKDFQEELAAAYLQLCIIYFVRVLWFMGNNSAEYRFHR